MKYFGLLLGYIVWFLNVQGFAQIPLNNPVKMVADYQRSYIYVIQPGGLLFLNTSTGSIDKTIAIGSHPTGASIDYPESRLYISDNSGVNPPIYVVDLNAQTFLTNFTPTPAGYYYVSAIGAGSIIAEENGVVQILSTTNGTVLNYNGGNYTPLLRGTGEVEPTGNFYYHGDDNNGSAHVYKFQIVSNEFVNVANGPQHSLFQIYYLIMSHDGQRIFWNQYEYDTNLNELGGFGTQIFACSSNGAFAFSGTQVFDVPTLTPFYNLPTSTSVMVVDGVGQNLWYYNSTSNLIQSLPLSVLQLPPTITHNPTNQNIYSGNNALVSVGVAGPSPMSFFWYLNGTNVAITTNSQLVLSNMQPTMAGNYSVLVSNAYGTATSSNAALSVQFVSPFIVSQPTNAIQIIGSNVTFSISVAGSTPVSYQWQFNGVDIGGATNAILALNNLQNGQEGFYDVVITNAYGGITSSNAYLNVIDISEALNTTNLTWTSGGDLPWFVETSITEDGFAALQSGPITANQQSIVETTVNGPATLTFWWNVSSEADNDYLSFSVNGSEQGRISGLITGGFYGWTKVTNYLGSDLNTLDWAYVKTDSGVSSSGRDSGWLDDVTVTPGGTAPFFSIAPTNQAVLLGSNATLSAVALGTPQLNYQWRCNLTNIDGATNSSLTITSAQYVNQGNYDLIVSNAYGVTDSVPALLFVVGVPEALNATNVVWSTSGDLPWFAETSTTHDSVAALQSGPISSNQHSTIQTTVSAPGTLSFWWKVSSEPSNDFANFSIDGVEQARISGNVDWQAQTYYLATGNHTLSWAYQKNATINSGFDAAWLDQVSYVAGGVGAFITNNPTDQIAILNSNATFTVTALGTPPLLYLWVLNGNAITNGTNASLTITNAQISNSGKYQVLVTNSYGGALSSVANLFLQNVVAWGAGTTNTGVSNNFGQSLVPLNLARVTGIAAGGFHSQAMLANGMVTDWGDNQGLETNVPNFLTNAMAISSGLFHSIAVRSNGTVLAWGQNVNGQLNVPSSATNIQAIASGWYHNLALRSNGIVVAWGAGTTQGSAPNFGQSIVPTNLAGVMAVAAGGYHSLALLSNSTVVAWGWNASGQTNVPAGLSNVVAIAAGGSNSLALRNDGTLVVWGDNSFGQTNIPVGLSNVVAISAGAAHNLVLKSDGSLLAWGLNTNGQTNIPTGLTNVVSISAGGYHNLATINIGPVTFLRQPYNSIIFKGANASFNPAFLGAGPLSIQWLYNGNNIVNATNISLIISNAQFADTGTYQLVVSNSFGAVTSAVASLVVNDTAPFFTSQPTNQTVLQKSNATFSAGAGGVPPIGYQWLFNGTNIAGATNTTLTVTNVQVTNAGMYALIASNSYGTNTSSNASLTVIDLGYALNATNLVWTSGGTSNWYPETIVTHDGVVAAQSGAAGSGQFSSLQTVVTGPGTLTFWWNVSSFGTLSFATNGTPVTSISSVGGGWRQPNAFYLAAGSQTLLWNYSGGFISQGSNAAWLDQVSFVPGGTSAIITSSPTNRFVLHGTNVSFSASAVGTPPLTYQWQFNSNNIAGKTSASFTLTNVQNTNSGIYSVIVSNVYGVAVTNATLLVRGPQFSSGGAFDGTGGGFTLQLNGLTGHGQVIIYSSTNLVTWQAIFTNSPVFGTIQFTDTNISTAPQQFYRATEE